MGLTVSAVASSDFVPYADKLPIETPNFKPTIDGKKDVGYTVDTPVSVPGGSHLSAHSNVTVSTAWYGNTLYFYIYIPDTTPQTSTADTWMYDLDGVWFLLDFGGDREIATMWKTQKTSKVFKILPATEQVLFIGCVHEESIQPVTEDDLEYKVVWDDNGYSLEVAYTVPSGTSTLTAAQEIAFELEVFDVNVGNNTWYRYHINNDYQNGVENYCTAWSAKLVLKEASASDDSGNGNADTGDVTVSIAIAAVVAVVAFGVVLKKKRF